MSQATAVTRENYEQAVLDADKVVLMKFWAPWCVPCKVIAQAVEEVADERADTLKVVSVNIDDAAEIAAEQGVRGIPTLMLFKSGVKVASLVGAHATTDLDAFLDKHV